MIMRLHYIAGISGDHVEVYLNEKLTETYSFGYNASYNREQARYAEIDYNNSIKYGWKSAYYRLKPYIGDLVADIVETNYIQNEDIEYSGRYVFSNRDMTKEEAKKEFDRLFTEV